MGIVLSLLLIGAGAIMRFAVTVEGNGFNIDTAGMVLMIVGAIGAVLSVAYWASWGGFSRFGPRPGGTTIQRTVDREHDVR